MNPDHNRVPTIEDVRAAQQRCNGKVLTTPLLESPLLNKQIGKRLLIKAECLQITGAFKFRGAWSALSSLTQEQLDRGVLAYSSGNHAQAIAYAAALHHTRATIIMPNDAPALKRTNTEAYGAEVVLYDRPGGEDREAIGQELAKQRGCTLIKPYDNTQVISGQGTCGLELAQQLAERRIEKADVLVCCGGGGLTAGITLALEADAPGITVRPVEPVNYDDVARSIASGKRESVVDYQPSICDAIVTPSPGELTFPIIKRSCGAGLVVSDDEALQAIAVAQHHFKLVAEPGGAVALAATLFRQNEILADTIVCVVSGGNVAPDILTRALSRVSSI
ncbi:threonine ammonia-lyase [Chromatiales bacterium (ex Bugula neritina AB1)]|nr:threonine ammonia-lyase [Chromatiales bacterium (ex Bugula neritina AB1)]